MKVQMRAASVLFLVSGFVPLHAVIVNCSPPATIANTFADPSFGATAATCGNVTVSGGVALADASSGTQLASTLESFLGGLSSLTSTGGLAATDGSAVLFNFTAPAGAKINFLYNSFFDPGTTAFTFAVLDGTVTTLAEQDASLASINTISFISGSLTTATGGSHTLGFGTANGCGVIPLSSLLPGETAGSVSAQACPLSALDPNLSVEDVNLSATPEPGTILLLGAGLAGLCGWKRKRRG